MIGLVIFLCKLVKLIDLFFRAVYFWPITFFIQITAEILSFIFMIYCGYLSVYTIVYGLEFIEFVNIICFFWIASFLTGYGFLMCTSAFATWHAAENKLALSELEVKKNVKTVMR